MYIKVKMKKTIAHVLQFNRQKYLYLKVLYTGITKILTEHVTVMRALYYI